MKRLALLLALLLPALAIAQTPTTASIQVSWNAVTECTQGTATVTCPGSITYNVYIGTNGSGSEGKPALEQGLTGTSVMLPGYTVGATIYGYVTAVVDGVESPPSAEVSFVVVANAPAAIVPMAPGGVAIGPAPASSGPTAMAMPCTPIAITTYPETYDCLEPPRAP